jgi:CPA2 family monovalent cation:H+ antiporter-2
MAHQLELILTLTGGLTAALVLGFITERLRLSPIVGYLLAGIAVGPFTPGFVAHGEIASQLAEIGIILLMFGVGLHFHVKELLAVRKVAIPGAILQIAVATALGMALAHYFGWRVGAGVVFGLALSVASTVVLLRVLADNDALHTPSGHVAVGWLLVEDLFTVFVLVILPVLFESQGGSSAVWIAIVTAMVKILALVAVVLVVGQRVVPAILAYVARTRSRELFTLSVLVLALGIAVGAAELFGASMALGAFLAGMVVGQSEFSSRAASEALPMRDAFAVLFFVSVGMLFDPSRAAANAALIAGATAIILVGKPLAAYVAVRLLRHPTKTAVSVGVALAQIGEFSFILGGVGQKLGVLPEEGMQTLVASSILSITVNPLLYRLVEPAAKLLGGAREDKPPAREGEPLTAEASAEEANDRDRAHRAIVVGYGPVGSTVTRLLRENELVPTVIELNHETVSRLRDEGVRAIYGDAAQRTILEQAGVRQAGSLVFAASGTAAEAVISIAKELNPEIRILARTHYVREVPAARKAGADVVVSAEVELAMAMTEHLLRELGATRDQLDRARDRVRHELSAG